MDELPSASLVAILEHLPPRDLVRCRLVNKLWKHLIDSSIKKSELILFIGTNPQPHWWMYSGESVNLENSIQADCCAFTSESFFNLFKRVKRLFLSCNVLLFIQYWTDNFSWHFSDTLEHLQIDYLTVYSPEQNHPLDLTLKNLRTFCYSRQLSMISCKSIAVSLDSDRLTQLHANIDLSFESNSMISRFASNLRVLFANQIAYTEPLEFPNLERLGCCNAPDFRFLVYCLPSLKEFFFSTHFTKNKREIEHSITDFLRTIEWARRKVKVFWFGMRFTLANTDQNLGALLFFEQKTICGLDSTSLDYFKRERSHLQL